VNDLRDPKRLRALAAPGSVLERGLAGARDRGPSDAEVQALGAALFGSLAVAVAPTVKAAISGWRFAGLTKATTMLIAAGAVAGASGVAWHHHRARRTDPVIASRSASAQAPATSPSAPQIVPLELPAPATVARPAPSPVQRKHVAPAARPATGLTSDDSADQELMLIGAAERALPGDPARALALVREHERRYPDGLLGQEREVVAVSALWQTGHRDQARQRAERFTAEHAGSTYVARMRQIVSQSADALINEPATNHQGTGGQR